MDCKYNAPMFGFPLENSHNGWKVVQGNCHHWDCPRCGEAMAKKWYATIAHGAGLLASQDHELRFMTLTCKGKHLSKSDAEAGFGQWTNTLQTALRASVKRAGGYWAYIAVTERQKRGHPHLHTVTTFIAHDEHSERRWRYKVGNDGQRRREYYDALRSQWLQERITSAGLGEVYDVQSIDDHGGSVKNLAKYLGKYLFKSQMFEQWPQGWRRIRTSQNWPKLPETENDAAFPLANDADWFAFRNMQPEFVRLEELDREHEWTAAEGLAGLGKLCRVVLPSGELKYAPLSPGHALHSEYGPMP